MSDSERLLWLCLDEFFAGDLLPTSCFRALLAFFGMGLVILVVYGIPPTVGGTVHQLELESRAVSRRFGSCRVSGLWSVPFRDSN